MNLKKQEVEMDWGLLYRYEAGEEGRGRRLLYLPTSPNAIDIEAGLHKDLTIGFTKTGRPRVNKVEDNKMYMLLSTEGGYTRRGNGVIYCLFTQENDIKILSRGNGADGDAGRIGYWDVLLLEVSGEVVIRVRTGGGGYGTPSDLYVVHSGNVFHCTLENVNELYDQLSMDIPFRMDDSEGILKYVLEDWKEL